MRIHHTCHASSCAACQEEAFIEQLRERITQLKRKRHRDAHGDDVEYVELFDVLNLLTKH